MVDDTDKRAAIAAKAWAILDDGASPELLMKHLEAFAPGLTEPEPEFIDINYHISKGYYIKGQLTDQSSPNLYWPGADDRVATLKIEIGGRSVTINQVHFQTLRTLMQSLEDI